MNQLSRPKWRLPHVWDITGCPHRRRESIGSPFSGPETTGAHVALFYQRSADALMGVMARPTTPASPPAHPASASQEDQGTDHRKMRIIGASDIRVPSGPSTNHIRTPRWGPCSKAWTSRPIWLGSRLNSLLRGLWRPRRRSHSAQGTTHTHSHKDQVEVVLARCCHPAAIHPHSPTSPSSLPLVLVSFQPTQLIIPTLHSLSSLVGDCVVSRLETPSQVACKRISTVQGPLPLVSAPITNAQKPTTDCQIIATKQDPDLIP